MRPFRFMKSISDRGAAVRKAASSIMSGSAMTSYPYVTRSRFHAMSSSFRSPNIHSEDHWATSRLGSLRRLRGWSPDAFAALIDRLHQAGIGVILDWVPGHFPTMPTALPASTGPRFTSTKIRAACIRTGTPSFTITGERRLRTSSKATRHYWLEHLHIDGLRVDAVASMLYLDYSRKAGEWVPNRYGGRREL